MSRGKYILVERMAIEVDDLMTWARWFEDNWKYKHVAATRIGTARVSTIFLGLDHSFAEDGPPILFETMIFNGPADQYQRRCSTWKQAEAMHKEACEYVRKAMQEIGALVNAAMDIEIEELEVPDERP